MRARERKRLRASVVTLVLLLSFLPVLLDEDSPFVTVASAATLYVDIGGTCADNNPCYDSIQAAVDNATVGDEVFVYNGTYYEDVYVNKTLNLTGESRDTTVINASSIGISVEYTESVNVSGFTVEDGTNSGIRLIEANNSRVHNISVHWNKYGIKMFFTNNTLIENNIMSENGNYHGIYLHQSTNNTVKNNICSGNQGKGIYIFDESSNNLIIGNNCSSNADGISITPFDPEFSSAMDDARDFMRSHRNAFRELAK